MDTDDDVDPEDNAAWRLRELARVEEERERREHAERAEEGASAGHVRGGEGGVARGESAGGDGEGEDEDGVHAEVLITGAFFQEAADDRFGTAGPQEIYKRDFSEATGADRGVDKSNLPRAMQVRGDKFGKMGQTKWTHLAAEDTSRLGEDPFGKDQEYRRKTTREAAVLRETETLANDHESCVRRQLGVTSTRAWPGEGAGSARRSRCRAEARRVKAGRVAGRGWVRARGKVSPVGPLLVASAPALSRKRELAAESVGGERVGGARRTFL